MCGRYNFTVEQSDEVKEILEKINAKVKNSKAKSMQIKTREIFPTNLAPILLEDRQKVEPALSIWGFPQYNRKGVIINARAETAFEKRTFRDSLINRRCIIPSTGFYEWDSRKRKFLFRLEGTNALYMAGLYQFYGEELRFVILTTGANASMKEVHDRMPLVLRKDEIEPWILDQGASGDFLRKEPPLLIKELTENQQIELEL